MQPYILIAAYNEVLTIRNVVSELLEWPDLDAKIIVVDDGSIDKTADEINGLGITLLRNEKNMGKGYSLWRGLNYAIDHNASYVITMDADSQHDPADIPNLVEKHRSDTDALIVGNRMQNTAEMPALRRFGNKFSNFWVSWACAQRLPDTQCGFRLYPASFIKHLTSAPSSKDGFAYETILLIMAHKLKHEIIYANVSTRYGDFVKRKSHYKAYRDTSRIVRYIAKYLLSKALYLQGLYSILFRRTK